MRILARKSRINGRRGAFQMLFGLAYLGLSISVLVNERLPSSIRWLDDFWSVNTTALFVIWGIAGSIAVISSFLPRPQDRWGFAALAAAPILWGGILTIGGILTDYFHPGFYYGTIIYWAMGGAVMVVSGMNGDHDNDDRKF